MSGEDQNSSAHLRLPRKRHLDDDDDDGDMTIPAAKRQKRLQKNRESAARSREKKARLFKEMQVQVSELTEKNNQLTRTLALLTNQCENMAAIREENRDLRDKLHKLELQIARTEVENQTLRSQYEISGDVSAGRPPLPTTQSPDNSNEDDSKRQSAPTVPTVPVSAVNTFPPPSSFPNVTAAPPAVMATNDATTAHSSHQMDDPTTVNRHVEELTQLLLQRNPTNGICTSSVPSCLPVQLYTCPNPNNNLKQPPKYYTDYSMGVGANNRGQFTTFTHSAPHHVHPQGTQQQQHQSQPGVFDMRYR